MKTAPRNNSRRVGLFFPAIFKKSMLPTLDNLRNFLLKPTTEMLSFFQILRAQQFGTHAA